WIQVGSNKVLIQFFNTRGKDEFFLKIIKKHHIHPQILEVIKLSGLYATITLQHVKVLYGLHVNGDLVLGNEMTRVIRN
ncbi:hypothetical protein H5410_005351, partial [Solanum commersonii]